MDGFHRPHLASRLRQERLGRNWHQRDVAEHLGTTVVTVNRWERGVQQPSTYFRVKLCVLFGKSAQELGFLSDDQPHSAPVLREASPLAESPPISSSASFPKLWSIPYPHNPFFTGREAILHHLHELLSRQRTMLLTQSCTINGLGGIGKTQTVLEYAYRHSQNYSAVLWVSAKTVESMISSFVTIAELLKLSEKGPHEHFLVVDAVIRWLTDHADWLLIFDNVEDPELLKRFLPPARRGCLLFTSRRQGLGLTSNTLKLDQMPPEEGMRFLLRRAGWLDTTASFDQLAPTDQALAKEIVAAMGGLPLALDQAG
ncbi:MAG TPA: NB-ARC domain-containing protein, partial [Ktedonobacteraceae bacterium]